MGKQDPARDPSAASQLRCLGLLDVVKPGAAPIRESWDAKDGRLLKAFPTGQLGLPAHELVRRIRDAFPTRSIVRQVQVTRVIPDAERPRVILDDGAELTARVIVIATGTAPGLVGAPGIERQTIGSAPFSFASGFDVEPTRDRAFPFQSLTYYPEGTATRIGYLSLFQVPAAMRDNLFTYHAPGDAWVEAFRQRLAKIVTDVKLLCSRYLPRWLDAPTLEARAIEQFYADPEKAAIDHDAVARALYRKQVSLDASLRVRLHRGRSYAAPWARDRWERVSSLVARVRR